LSKNDRKETPRGGKKRNWDKSKKGKNNARNYKPGPLPFEDGGGVKARNSGKPGLEGGGGTLPRRGRSMTGRIPWKVIPRNNRKKRMEKTRKIIERERYGSPVIQIVKRIH